MRREAAYRGNRPPTDVEGRTVILVDDGIATGSTMRVAIAALREQKVGHIVVATPTAPTTVRWEMEALVDDFIAVITPEDFYGVGQWYDDFTQIDDDSVPPIAVVRSGRREENLFSVPPAADSDCLVESTDGTLVVTGSSTVAIESST